MEKGRDAIIGLDMLIGPESAAWTSGVRKGKKRS